MDQLDEQVETAERRRKEAEIEAKQLEEVKLRLEEAVVNLQTERDTMMQEMKKEEFQMAK